MTNRGQVITLWSRPSGEAQLAESPMRFAAAAATRGGSHRPARRQTTDAARWAFGARTARLRMVGRIWSSGPALLHARRSPNRSPNGATPLLRTRLIGDRGISRLQRLSQVAPGSGVRVRCPEGSLPRPSSAGAGLGGLQGCLD